jgi:mannitol/fructose-specific phosphotransferase system IIA component (Ntr-type)
MKLGDFIVTDAIIPQLKSVERDDVIRELVDGLVEAGTIERELADVLVKRIIDREVNGSTGFGKGVAVPHVKHEKLKQMAGAIGVSPSGVDFNALDKQPVYSVVLLLSPADKPDEHLQAMENIFRNLQNDTFRKFLRQATTREDIEELISEADNHQLAG